MEKKIKKLLSLCLCVMVCAVYSTPVFAAESLASDSTAAESASSAANEQSDSSSASENSDATTSQEDKSSGKSDTSESKDSKASEAVSSSDNVSSEDSAASEDDSAAASEEDSDSESSEEYGGTICYRDGTESGLKWHLSAQGRLTISGKGEMPNFSTALIGYMPPWAPIESTGFLGAKVKSVVIEDGVTSIGSGAFLTCQSLTKVTMADSVTSMGERAFSVCNSLRSVKLSNSLEAIPEGAFVSCLALREITIPESVISIGKNAFTTSGLRKITIPNSVTTLGDEAFKFCSSLEEITIPESVTSLGSDLFEDATSLSVIYCNPNSTAWTYAQENSISWKCIDHVLESSEVEEEPTCTETGLEYGKCKNCSFEGDVVIPAKGHTWSTEYTTDKEPTCTETGSKSQHCTVCGAINEESVISIPANGHTWATEYTVDTEPTTTKDGQRSKHCTICDSIDKSSIETIAKIDGVYGGTIANGNIVWALDKDGTIKLTGEGAIPNFSRSGDNVPPWTNNDSRTKFIKNIVIGEGITSIGEYAFAYCENTESISLPSTLTSIESLAFSGNYALKEITIPESVTNIGASAFAYATNLSKVYIKGNNTRFDTNAFKRVVKADGTVTVISSPNAAARVLADGNEYTTWECDEHTWGDYVTDEAATCLKVGSEHRTCTVCGKEESRTIPATGHTWKTYTQKAGYLKNGTTYSYCTKCGMKKNVKTLAGYSKYIVKKLKVKKGKKSFKVSWKKASKANKKVISGYQIRYSKKSSMASSKYVKASKTSKGKTIKKLSKKTKYYVQLRNYMKKGGKTYYSMWSAKKTVKTK